MYERDNIYISYVFYRKGMCSKQQRERREAVLCLDKHKDLDVWK